MCRSQHFCNFMRNKVIDVLTAIFQILARVKVIRMLGHMETDTGCQSQADIGVDVDFADCQASCLAELVFRNTNSIREITSIFINNLYVFR